MIKEKITVEQLASELVKIKSYSSMQRPEEEIAEFIYRFLIDHDIEAEKIEVNPGRYNVIGKIQGNEKSNSLMLCGHMDTVPAYDMPTAFSGEIKNGILYGRGSCDMKGSLAAMMCAVAEIKKSGTKMKGDLVFAALADEEETGMGAEALVKSGPFTTATIIGEPSSMSICIGQKGLEWIKVTIKGKKVHGGDMDNGVNAIAMSRLFMNTIMDNYIPKLNKREHPILGRPTINFGTIHGGDQPSTVPDSCEITLDRRYVPGETRKQVYTELEEVIKDIRAQNPEFAATIDTVFTEVEMLPHNPFCINPDSPIINTARSALHSVNNKHSKLKAFPAWTDAGIIREHTGSDCIILGPGDISLAHSANESIKVADLKEAALVYKEIALDYCGIV